MFRAKIKGTSTLAGIAPAGKLNHTNCGVLPLLEPPVATLGKLNLKRACAVLALMAATAIALPAQTLTTLFSFDGTDGETPGQENNCNLPLVQGTNGDLYGTTYLGGANAGPFGFGGGTVFKITPGGTLTTLYNFCSQSGCPDGYAPGPGLVQATNGDFYGITNGGGANGLGTFFRITPSGELTTLYSFCCADGFEGIVLVQAPDGDFYGTAGEGGPTGWGTFFKITPAGMLTTLYNFCSEGGGNCSDGAIPNGIIQAVNGDFYGTTQQGGANQTGTVFKVTPSGALTTLYSFPPGTYTYAGLIQATNGDIYGTTYAGGQNGAGIVFKITPTGAFTTLYSFCSQGGFECTDGGYPSAALVQATDGNFYGTTEGGGAHNGGTAFKITPAGALTTLYSFCSEGTFPNCTDGEEPNVPLAQDTDGSFYGSTPWGGGASPDDGTIFRLSVGLGPFVETQTTSGEVGGMVKILGTDLTGATSVSFNGTAAGFEVVSPSLIVAKVPTGATTGTVKVVTPSGTLSSNVPFRVLP